MFVLYQSVKVLVKLFGELAGLGRAHKNGVFFLPSFFFAPLVPKKKRDNGILCFFVGKVNFLKEAFLSPHPHLQRTLPNRVYFFVIICAFDYHIISKKGEASTKKALPYLYYII